MTADLFGDFEETAMSNEASNDTGRTDKGGPAAKSGKSKPDAVKQADLLRFEEAYDRLGELVAEMERGELPLEGLIDRFEEGVKLAQQCQDMLKQAQLRVEQYIEQKDGHWVLKELDRE